MLIQKKFHLLFHLESLNTIASPCPQMTFNARDVDWSTWTCILGFPVMGIWPDGSDGTDVNAVDRSKDGEFLVTSDDFGMVKLFNYPCVIDDAPHRWGQRNANLKPARHLETRTQRA